MRLFPLKWPLWLKAGLGASIVAIVIESIYVASVLLKTKIALIVFPLHIVMLFPAMLTASTFTSPLFLVEKTIPPAKGIILLIASWFLLGALIAVLIEFLRPHYPTHETHGKK